MVDALSYPPPSHLATKNINGFYNSFFRVICNQPNGIFYYWQLFDTVFIESIDGQANLTYSNDIGVFKTESQSWHACSRRKSIYARLWIFFVEWTCRNPNLLKRQKYITTRHVNNSRVTIVTVRLCKFFSTCAKHHLPRFSPILARIILYYNSVLLELFEVISLACTEVP